MIPLPSPQQLRYLTSLAELRHFGRAASACGVTQSTLSAGVLALERQLDVAILDRDAGRRVVFTPLGRELVGRALDALAALEAVAGVAVASHEPMAGALRFGMIPTVAPFLLPRLLPVLRQNFPKLRLSLNEDLTGHLVDRLGAARLDLLLLAMPCDCENLETLALARDPFLVALPPNHRLAGQADVALHDLESEPMLLLEDGHCLRDQVLSACRQAGAWSDDDDDRFTATSLQTLVRMVESGLGVTLLPRLAVEGGVASGARVVLRPIVGEGSARTIGLAWRPRAPRQQEVAGIAAIIKTRLEADQAMMRSAW